MRRLINSSRVSMAVVAVLVGLLAVLATLQYRWIAQLSKAERIRLQEGVDLATEGYCEDFDREVARAFAIFAFEQPADDAELTKQLDDRLTEWRSTTIWPGLVQRLTVTRLDDKGEISALCFDEQAKSLSPCNWGEEQFPIRYPRTVGPRVPIVDGDLPGLVIAIEGRVTPPGKAFEWRPPRDHLIVRFDPEFISTAILPELAEIHFGANGEIPYLLRVSSLDRRGETIFQNTQRIPFRAADPDASERLFGLRTFPEFLGQPPVDRGMRKRPPPRGRQGRPAGPPPENRPPPEMSPRTEEGLWVLAVRHPQGSLENAVAMARRRNMAISVVMLVMLGITSTLMVFSTRRARRLARQQMDFVAAVSHELRTPLTAIRSAGQNLADGIIDDPEKVRNYGLLIEKEGRRLTEMIGRVLTFAGIRSGRQIYRMEPVEVSVVVNASLEDCAWAIEETGFEVETEIAHDLPQINGDAVALRRVFTNLCDNAMKYASAGRWLGIRVWFEPTQGNGEVKISVSDRGPGIPKRELSTVFDPFRRGADVSGGGIPGSGIGLAVVRSVVEAHGGAVEITSSSAGGAKFTVRLPALTARATKREKKI